MATGGESMGDIIPDEKESALMDRIQQLQREKLEQEKSELERCQQDKLERERRERDRHKAGLHKRLKLLEGAVSSNEPDGEGDSKPDKTPAARKLPHHSSTYPLDRQTVTGTSPGPLQTAPTTHSPHYTQMDRNQVHRDPAAQGAPNQAPSHPSQTYEDGSLHPTSTAPPATTAAVSTAKLWDKTNSEEQQIVCYSSMYKGLLNNKRIALTECVDIQRMKPHLKQLEVVDKATLDGIMLNATPEEAVDRLTDYLECSPTWKIHAFCRALALSDQSEKINLLGLDPAQYEETVPPRAPETSATSQGPIKTRKRHFYKRIESDECLQISDDLLLGLLEHCGSYDKTLMKTTLFGLKKKCVIDLTQIYVCTSPTCSKNQRERVPIGKKDLFLSLFGERCPSCLSMEGPAGAGKSSFVKEYAYDWSKDVLSCEKKGPDVSCRGHRWKMVVYIPGSSIRGNAWNAIRDNLRCHPKRKDQMMMEIEEDGEGVLIEYDALDEVRTKESIESISSYTETSQTMVGKPRVLVTARDGLLGIDHRFFDRRLHLDGFSLKEGVSYMEQYFKNEYNLPIDHPVLQHVRTHQQDLEWALSNPLRLQILSELTAYGSLTLGDLEVLTTVKLFRSLDELLVKRDRECRPKSRFQPEDFYKSCLRCLMQDERVLPGEEVDGECPYLSFIDRHNYMDKDFNDCCDFSFPHEVLFEYFSMRGLIQYLKDDGKYKYSILMYLCSKPTMRNTLQLTCSFIVHYEPKLLPYIIFIIRACLILQTEYVWFKQTELTKELLQLSTVIQESVLHNVLSDGVEDEQAATLEAVKDRIETVFTEDANGLREAGWFLNGYPTSSDGSIIMCTSAFHEFILRCLQYCDPQQYQDICRQTTHTLLPITRYRRGTRPIYYTVLPVDGVRWVTFKDYDYDGTESFDVTFWCLYDLKSALHTWSHLPTLQQRHPPSLPHRQYLPTYNLYIDWSAHRVCPSLPADPWSEDQWIPSLRELLSPRYCAGYINIDMDYTNPKPPVAGLLSACRNVITPGHGLGRGLCIQNSEVGEEELTAFCTWAAEVRLRLQLWQLTVVMREVRGGEWDWKDTDSNIRRLVEPGSGREKGEYYKPTYITAHREVLCRNYWP